MRIDNGQQLDIVYTTQSFLLVIPTDGQTSILIPKNEPELLCSTFNANDDSNAQFIGLVTGVTLIELVSGYIFVIHFIFKELHNAFGKLMMFFNISIVWRCASVTVLAVMHFKIAVYSKAFCFLFMHTFTQSIIVSDGFATCIIAYLAYIMYCTYKRKLVTESINKKILKYSMIYTFGSLILLDIFMISYDFGTGTFKHIILPNGHCSFFDQPEYDTTVIVHANGTLNKAIGTLLFVVYFIYYYKLNKMLKVVRDMANVDRQHNQLFLRVALTMAATLGVTQVFIVMNRIIDIKQILRVVPAVSLLIQQCVIMILCMCTKKMSQLCKEKFFTTETSS